jgi:hypothetical protein
MIDLKKFINEGRLIHGLTKLEDQEINEASNIDIATDDIFSIWDDFYDDREGIEQGNTGKNAKQIFIEGGIDDDFKKKVEKKLKTRKVKFEIDADTIVLTESVEEKLNEEAYDWLRDHGLNPRKSYSVRQLEREIGRKLTSNEIGWLKSEGVINESVVNESEVLALNEGAKDHNPIAITNYMISLLKDSIRGFKGDNTSADTKHPNQAKVNKHLREALKAVKAAKREIKDKEFGVPLDAIWFDDKRYKTYILEELEFNLESGLFEAGKTTIDIDWAGDEDGAKAVKKFKIKFKDNEDGTADLTGDKKNLIKYLKSDFYGLDDSDIEAMFPELLESLNERELSPLQKEYQQYFKDTLAEFDVDSPAKLSAEKKLEFFKAIKSGWVVGKGKKGK